MEVLVDASSLRTARTEVRAYARGILRHILLAGGGHVFHFCGWPGKTLGDPSAFLRPLPFSARSRLELQVSWREAGRIAARGDAVLYSPVGLPRGCDAWALPAVGTILDERPRSEAGPGASWSAGAISAIPRPARSSLGGAPGVHWIPPGLWGEDLEPEGSRNGGLPGSEYAVALGPDEGPLHESLPRLWRLLRAWGRLRREGGKRPRLIFLGKRSLLVREAARLLGVAEQVGFADAARAFDAARLIASASLFVQADDRGTEWLWSLEAMRLGVPVIAPRGAAAGLFGDAALYYRPGSPAELGARVDEALRSRSLRRAVAQRGIRRSLAFSWDAAALRVLEVLERALEAAAFRFGVWGMPAVQSRPSQPCAPPGIPGNPCWPTARTSTGGRPWPMSTDS